MLQTGGGCNYCCVWGVKLKLEKKINKFSKVPGADKSLARPGRKQARKDVRDGRDFDKIKTRAVIKFFFLQGKAPKEIHTILTETLACLLPGRAKDLSAPLYICFYYIPFCCIDFLFTVNTVCISDVRVRIFF